MNVQVLLIEHEDVGGLYPFTQMHCSWELRFGAFTIYERWKRAVPTIPVTVASERSTHLASFVERYPSVEPYKRIPTLIAAAHVSVSPSVMRRMVEMCSGADKVILFYCDSHPFAVFLPEPPESPGGASTYLEAVNPSDTLCVDVSGSPIHRLWQCLDLIHDAVSWDMALLEDGTDINASVHPTAILDSSAGPIIVMDHAIVGPFAVITGPCVIGSGTIIHPHSSLGSTITGPLCKLGGEVSHSIIQGYSNKAHDGFLGHSYLGEWCNLGAGTVTSNLKSTYGQIRVPMPWLEEDTQRMFLGALFGNSVRTAIGTKLLCGSVIGTNAVISTPDFCPKSLPAFSWLEGDAIEEYNIEKAISVQRNVMARRTQTLLPHTEDLYRSLHHHIYG